MNHLDTNKIKDPDELWNFLKQNNFCFFFLINLESGVLHWVLGEIQEMSESFTGRKIVNNDLNRQRKLFGICPPTGGSPLACRGHCVPASGRGELSCLAEIKVVQYDSVPVRILVTYHISVPRRRFNSV